MLKPYFFFIVLLAFSVLTLSGCAMIKDIPKGIVGVSTRELDRRRPDAIKRTYDCKYEDAFDMVLKALEEKGCYVYEKNLTKHLIAIYVSEQDTTPVGIYFNSSGHATEVEVSSPSTSAKELISEKIFSSFESSGIIKVR